MSPFGETSKAALHASSMQNQKKLFRDQFFHKPNSFHGIFANRSASYHFRTPFALVSSSTAFFNFNRSSISSSLFFVPTFSHLTQLLSKTFTIFLHDSASSIQWRYRPQKAATDPEVDPKTKPMYCRSFNLSHKLFPTDDKASFSVCSLTLSLFFSKSFTKLRSLQLSVAAPKSCGLVVIHFITLPNSLTDVV